MNNDEFNDERSESSEPRQEFRAEFLDLLGKAEALVGRVPQIARMIGGLAADVHEFGRDVGRFLRRHPGGALAGTLVAVGGSSLFGGWAPGGLTGSTLKISAPSVLVPTAVVFLFARRPAKSAEGGGPGSDGGVGVGFKHLAPELELEAVKRRYLNTQSVLAGQAEPLDARRFVAPYLAERAMRLRISGYEANLTLSRVTREGHGLKEVASRGSILGSLDGHFTVSFALGTHHYLLVCLLPGPATEAVKLEVSRAATGIGERYVHDRGDGGPSARPPTELAPEPAPPVRRVAA
jgi:hypothetical protein